jgi:hypothetical protein
MGSLRRRSRANDNSESAAAPGPTKRDSNLRCRVLAHRRVLARRLGLGNLGLGDIGIGDGAHGLVQLCVVVRGHPLMGTQDDHTIMAREPMHVDRGQHGSQQDPGLHLVESRRNRRAMLIVPCVEEVGGCIVVCRLFDGIDADE